MRRLAAVEGDLDTVASLQGSLEDLETLNQLALEEDDDSVAAELTEGLATLATAVEDLEVLALLRVFSDDVTALMQQETAEWVLEFQSNLLRLERSNSPRPGSVPLHGTVEP